MTLSSSASRSILVPEMSASLYVLNIMQYVRRMCDGSSLGRDGRVGIGSGARPHRRAARARARAPVRLPEDQVDLDRPGLCRRVQGRGRLAGRRSGDHRLRRHRPPDARSPHGRGPRPLGQGRVGAVLRPLRRPAGRSARAVGPRPVRALHRDPRRWDQGHPGARRLGRQGPDHDLRRGLPRLEGRHRRLADPAHPADRGRGGVRWREPAAVPRGQCRRAAAPTSA